MLILAGVLIIIFFVAIYITVFHRDKEDHS